MNVAYQGPLLDYSGYGEANRHFVAALEAAGVTVAGQLVSYAKDRADYGTLGQVVKQVLEQKPHYKIKIIHTTPDEIQRLKEPGKYHIAHFFWETDKVPEVFADGLNLVDEIWTGSEANRAAIERSGVKRPIKVIPQPIETERVWPQPYVLPDFDGYTFYSIFEWTDRKNPKTLINAFLEEFDKNENVGLLIKTYFRNFNLSNKRMIRDQIANIRAQLGDRNPNIFLYLDLMDRQQIMRLHVTGDCYVSAHKGEGWGVPQVEAGLAGHPMISTGYGGCHEYFEDGKDAILLPYTMEPLKGMSHSAHFYTNDQKWAEIEIGDLRKKMRYAFENQDKMETMGLRAQKTIVSTFNLERVGNIMADRLREIEATL